MALVESAGAAYVSTVTDTATSGTFTPTANSLIVAIAACGNASEVTGTGFTISSTFSGTTSNTWTIRKVYVGASGSGLVGIWVMDAGSAPGSGTVTVTTAPTTAIDTCLIVRQFAGAQPAASQNGATNSAEGTINTISLTPNATGSEIVGGSGSGATGAAYTANGVTTIYGQTSGSSTYAVFEGNALTTGGVAQVLGYTSTAQAVTGMAVAEILAATTATSSGPAHVQFSPSHVRRYHHKHFGPIPRQPLHTIPAAGYTPQQYAILLQYGGGSTGFPAVPGITVPGATDPGTPSQGNTGGLSVNGSIARESMFNRTLTAVSTVRGTVTRNVSRAFTAVLAITSTPKVGFSFFNQILPLGSLSSSVASTSDLGIQFNVTSSGYALSGYYVYIPSGGDTTASNYTFALYSTTNGTSGTQVGTTATGSGTFTAAAWNYVSLSSPLGLVNGTTYVATYHLIANDPYEYVLTYWSVGLGAGGITNGPITAPGTGTALGGNQEAYNQPAGASIAFPASNYMGSWYGIDVEVIGGTSAIQHLLTIAASLVTNSGNLGREIFITLPGKVWKQLF